jgi:tRNA-dihydrouridine synthase B
LLKNEPLVKDILENVTAAVDVPVTLKIRTGWDAANRNAVTIARIAEQAGIAALTIHGRTRACGFSGMAEYDTVRSVKHVVGIPIIVNGDIDSPQKAQEVLRYTGADAVMIGRAAQGRPWIFDNIEHFMRTGELLAAPPLALITDVVLNHLDALYSFYGNETGVKIARKHVGWYCSRIGTLHAALKQRLLNAETPAQQTAQVATAFAYFKTAGLT